MLAVCLVFTCWLIVGACLHVRMHACMYVCFAFFAFLLLCFCFRCCFCFCFVALFLWCFVVLLLCCFVALLLCCYPPCLGLTAKRGPQASSSQPSTSGARPSEIAGACARAQLQSANKSRWMRCDTRHEVGEAADSNTTNGGDYEEILCGDGEPSAPPFAPEIITGPAPK